MSKSDVFAFLRHLIALKITPPISSQDAMSGVYANAGLLCCFVKRVDCGNGCRFDGKRAS